MAIDNKKFVKGITLVDSSDGSKQFILQPGTHDTGNTYTLRTNTSGLSNIIDLPDFQTGILVTDTGSQNLENKTISGATLNLNLSLQGLNTIGASNPGGTDVITELFVKKITDPITGATNFNLTTGVISGIASLTSITANPSTVGVIRLAKTDVVSFRNNANSANLSLGISATDRPQFASIDLIDASTAQTLTNKTISGSTAASLINGSGTINHNSSGTITVPNATDTLVGKATTDLLTNKTFNSPVAGGEAVTLTYFNSNALSASGTQTLTNKSLSDSTTFIIDETDATKKMQFQVSGITTATTRTMTVPDADITIVGTTNTQTLTNKTIDTANTNIIKVNGNTLAATAGTATLTLPNTTDTIVGRNTTDTLASKTIDTASNTVKINGNIITATAGTATLNFPNSTDTMVARNTVDTLTSKTFGDPITMTQVGTPTNPAAGLNRIYTKSDDKAYILNSAGQETKIGSGAGLWVTATVYALNDTVIYSKNMYVCITGHTAGSTFEADIALSYWSLVNQPQIGRNYILVGNNFEDNDVGGWQKFTLQNQYTFTLTSALTVATNVGTVYTNNSQSFTVMQNAAIGATSLVTSGTGAPTAASTLVYSSGSGQTGSIAYTNNPTGFGMGAGVFPYTVPTLGTATSVAVASTAVNPISDKYSLSVTNTASTNFTAGQGVISQVYNIDRLDQAKILAIQCAYEAAANVTNGMAFPGTSANTFALAIYDVTNTAWIQPAGVYNLIQSSGVGISKGNTFQTPSNMTQFRLAIVCINTTTATTPGAGAMTLNLDNFFLGPQPTSSGAAMSDPVAYTPTFTGFGTPSAVNFVSWRVGAYLYFQGTFTNGTPTATEGRITLGYNGTNANVTTLSTLPTLSRVGDWSDTTASSTTDFRHRVVLAEASKTYITFGSETSTSGGSLVKQNGNAISGAGATISIEGCVPIVGWSSNTVQSADTDTRVVSFVGLKSGGTQAVTANVTDVTFVSAKDSHGAWSGSAYVVPVSGDYDIGLVAADSASSAAFFKLYVNGTLATNYIFPVGDAGNYSGGRLIYPNAKAGDSLSIRCNTSITLINSGNLSISRISGPATVQASESVNCRYTNTSSQAITNTSNAVITNWTSVYDSHSAMNATTGVYTVPVSGKYKITANLLSTSIAWTTAASARANLAIAGTQTPTMVIFPLFASQTNYIPLVGSIELNYNAGDTISLKIINNLGATYTLLNSSPDCWVSISRIGQ